MVIVVIILVIVCGFLGYSLYKAKADATSQGESIQEKLARATEAAAHAEELKSAAEEQKQEAETQKRLAEEREAAARRREQEAEDKYQRILCQYKQETSKGQEELDNFFRSQRATRQSELDTEFENKMRTNREKVERDLAQRTSEMNSALDREMERIEEIKNAALTNQNAIVADTEFQQKRFEALLEPLKKYEIEKQERLYYTIQVPDEYKDDINFLITTVSKKVQHPDIINKLVWAEYVKPYLDETIKRAGIEDKPGIYKLTNIDDGKCYIGKSTNVKKRIQDHFKASLNIGTIAHQSIHDAIWRTGFWNWTIESIIYCEKEQLSELEKYYINFFKAQEFGYNRNQGG